MEGGDNVGTLTLAVGHVVKKGGTMAWNFGKIAVGAKLFWKGAQYARCARTMLVWLSISLAAIIRRSSIAMRALLRAGKLAVSLL